MPNPSIFDLTVEQLVFAMRDVNLSTALNEKKQVTANEYVVSTLTDILTRAGHKVVPHKKGKTYMKVSIDGEVKAI